MVSSKCLNPSILMILLACPLSNAFITTKLTHRVNLPTFVPDSSHERNNVGDGIYKLNTRGQHPIRSLRRLRRDEGDSIALNIGETVSMAGVDQEFLKGQQSGKTVYNGVSGSIDDLESGTQPINSCANLSRSCLKSGQQHTHQHAKLIDTHAILNFVGIALVLSHDHAIFSRLFTHFLAWCK